MAQGQRWHIYSVQTDVCFPYGRWWKCWAAVGRRSPLPRTAYQMKLGAPEWFECSRALVCSSSEVFTSASQNILGLFVLSNIAHVLSIFHYGQFFHRYVRWWFKPQNTLELWRFIMVHLHFCSLSLLFVQFPWLLIPVHCCWFNPVLLVSFHPLFVLFNLPWLCSWNPPFYLVEIVPFPSFLLIQLQIWFISFRFLRLKSFCLQPNLAGSIARSGLWAVHGRFAWGGHIDTPKIRLLPSKVEISMGTSLVHSNIWHYSPSA